MKLLALDTSGEACSAALYLDGEIAELATVEPRRHGELILSMMDRLLADAGLRPGQLDALAFGRGPGSFTGVRIATGVVQGAAFAAGLPVAPVSTLAALAQRHYRENARRRSLAGFDARMSEVYWGIYYIDDTGLAVPLSDEEVVRPEAVSLPPGKDWDGVGSAWASYRQPLQQRLAGALVSISPNLSVTARDIAVLGAAALEQGRAVPPEQALPIYLRDEVARKS
jgi:tRNA threonylcarbamoyladenosine biosynthesis protein TsaB